MTTDTSRRTLRIAGPTLGVDFTVRYAEILGWRLDRLADRVKAEAKDRLPSGARLAFSYVDHHRETVAAWPTDSVEWLMKRAPVLRVRVAEPGDQHVV